MLRGMGKIASSGARALGSGARRFSGYQGGMAFSRMGKARMGAAVAGLGIAGMHNNSRRGGYVPKSSGTAGLQPRSTGGATML